MLLHENASTIRYIDIFDGMTYRSIKNRVNLASENNAASKRVERTIADQITAICSLSDRMKLEKCFLDTVLTI